jgi:hypothetical protein
MQEQLNPKKLYQEMEQRRNRGFDVTLSAHLHDNYDGFTIDQLYQELDIDPQTATVKLILDRQDESVRWLVPEIIRDAIRKGFINAPIHRDFILREEPIAQPVQTMPFWDMTGLDNAPKELGVAESMELGTIKYGAKSVRVGKTGIGIEIADECIQYTSVSLLSIFLSDVGIKLGSSLSRKAITCLISGDQADGSEAAAVVGVADTAKKLQYSDLIKYFVRGSLVNRKWTKCIGDEDTVNVLLNMPEFRNTDKFGTPELQLNVKTPVPRQIDAYCHSTMPTGQLLMADTSVALVQLTCQPLKVEAERIIQRQINGTYCSLTTGFSNIMRDGRIIVDTTKTFVASPWADFLAPKF